MSAEFDSTPVIYKGVKYIRIRDSKNDCTAGIKKCAFYYEDDHEMCSSRIRVCHYAILELDPDPINLITHRLTK